MPSVFILSLLKNLKASTASFTVRAMPPWWAFSIIFGLKPSNALLELKGSIFNPLSKSVATSGLWIIFPSLKSHASFLKMALFASLSSFICVPSILNIFISLASCFKGSNLCI